MKKKNKKKKNGFTLIELLAVILILGIIALIAVPTVNGVIEQARKDAYKTSVDNVVKAINQYIILAEINGEETLNGVYQISELKDILDMKNIDNLDGWVEIKGETITNYSFSNEKYVLTNNGDETVTQTISKMESSTLDSVFPYQTDYSDKIVNAYITYGSKPDNTIVSWSGNSDNTIDIYLVENNENSSLYDLYIVSLNKIIAPSTVRRMFYNFTELKKVYIDNFDTSKTTNFSDMFREDSKLEYINAEKFDTSNAKYLYYMFYNNKSLTNLDVSNFDTSKVANMSYMFFGCESLESLDVSKWNVSSATNINQMFHTMRKIKYLDLSNWDTSNVTSFAWLFIGDSMLSEIKGIENLNTSNVTNFDGVVSGTAIKNLDLSKWDTSKGTSMWQMFWSMYYLETLDLSGWDTSNVTKMDNMFNLCNNLTTIYVSDKWNTSKVESSADMFKGTTKLVGAVSYDDNKKDVSMANYTTGYLTLKS